MKFKITGDTHADFSRFYFNDREDAENPSCAYIVLGDGGVNFISERSDKIKYELSSFPCRFYFVRGNHDRRPQDMGIELMFDKDVDGWVYCEPEYPNIRYFKDFGIYNLNGYSCAVIGGAYSVDKWYRLQRKWTWYDNEQLSEDEQNDCFELMKNKHFDFVFSHTCPFNYRPTDLFLNSVIQSEVDTSMEMFLNKLKDNITYNTWLWGHYHGDRIEVPHCELMYHDIDDLDSIYNRWKTYDNTGELPWYIKKSPKFYMYDRKE